MTKLDLTVRDIVAETSLIKSFRLTASEGGSLPGFTPGAHIRVTLPDGGDRAYSLINLDPATDPTEPQPEYRVAVRLEEDSAGGSRFMHGLAVGDRLQAEGPKNDFPLVDDPVSITLLAGGIGITPLTGMAASLVSRKQPFSLHYAGRSRGALAFVDQLESIAPGKIVQHYDDDPETALNLSALVGGLSPSDHLYVCGPKGMIEAASSAARARGLADDHIHVELFTNQVEAAAGDAFEIELASSGEVLPVPEGKSIIDVLEEAGHDVLYDCQRGDCGICQTEVISGEPDHRDVVLSDDEKASGKVMQICVSRSKSPRLVLDL